MSARTKKILTFILVVFILYFIYSRPTSAGSFFAGIWNILVQAFHAIVEFFDTLLRKT